MVDLRMDGGDDGIVRAQTWIEHRNVGGPGIADEVAVETSLPRRAGLWLKAETRQRGSPPIQLRSQ